VRERRKGSGTEPENHGGRKKGLKKKKKKKTFLVPERDGKTEPGCFTFPSTRTGGRDCSLGGRRIATRGGELFDFIENRPQGGRWKKSVHVPDLVRREGKKWFDVRPGCQTEFFILGKIGILLGIGKRERNNSQACRATGGFHSTFQTFNFKEGD